MESTGKKYINKEGSGLVVKQLPERYCLYKTHGRARCNVVVGFCKKGQLASTSFIILN